MTPQERPEPGRTRREGNVTYLRGEFATRVRQMVIWSAKREAREAVIRRIKAEGKVKVSLMSAGEISSLANAHLREHAAELLATAEASRVVQNLDWRSAASSLIWKRNLCAAVPCGMEAQSDRWICSRLNGRPNVGRPGNRPWLLRVRSGCSPRKCRVRSRTARPLRAH